ncbi:MAG: hypothetical protein HYY02_06935 [Chloroflexi bacterium]|nr:hypothetical protein [Chloroflexota bacterium]
MRAALSQQTLAFKERDFFRERFTADEIQALAGSRPVSDLFSARSPSVAKLGLDPSAMSEEQMLEWMVREPRLVRRPFLVVDGRLVVQPKPGEIEALTD